MNRKWENLSLALQKHTYWNILKILLPKNENFQIKSSDMSHISAQNIDCGIRYNRLDDAVLTSTHNLSFWAEIRKKMYTPVNPSLTTKLKRGFKGVKII